MAFDQRMFAIEKRMECALLVATLCTIASLVWAETPVGQHATRFSIEKRPSHTVITVTNVAPGSVSTFRYVLHPRGVAVDAAIRDGADAVIPVPVKRVIALSTTCIPHLKHSGAIDTLVGVEQAAFVSTPEARARLASGKARAVGLASGLDVERIIALQPDLVVSYVLGQERAGVHGRLARAGIPVVLSGSYMEQSPLGRAEWIRFTAEFVGRSAEATRFFEGIETEYRRLQALVAKAARQPTVLMNAPFKGQWYVPGGKSYAAELVRDAGGVYLFGDSSDVSGIPMPFERVYEAARNAEVWLNPSAWNTRAEGLSEDSRFKLFSAFESGAIYNNNAQMNPDGGSDIFENGVVNPHQVLADLIHILHPDLLPGHTLHWYHRLP